MRSGYQIKGRLGFNSLVSNAQKHLEIKPAGCTLPMGAVGRVGCFLHV